MIGLDGGGIDREGHLRVGGDVASLDGPAEAGEPAPHLLVDAAGPLRSGSTSDAAAPDPIPKNAASAAVRTAVQGSPPRTVDFAHPTLIPFVSHPIRSGK